MLKMQKVYCLSFKISTQNLILSVSCCLQHMSLSHIAIASSRPIDGNFGTNEKVAIHIPLVTCTLLISIPIFCIFLSHGNGNPIPMHISSSV